MIRITAFSALPLAALTLFPFAYATARAEGASPATLIAQAEQAPAAEDAAPNAQAAPENGDEGEVRKPRKRDRDRAAPPPGADAAPGADTRGQPRERRRKSADEKMPPAAGSGKKHRDRVEQEAPPVKQPEQSASPAEPEPEPAAEEPPRSASPAETAPAEAPRVEKRREKRAAPSDDDEPKMQAQPKRVPDATAEQPPQQPTETKRAPSDAKPRQTEAAPPVKERGGKRAGSEVNIEEVKKRRRQRTEEGGKRTVIEEPGNRVIVKEGDRAVIRHDETERLRRTARDVRREKRKDGTSVTIAVRPGGIEVYSVFDDDGRLIRRYRRGKDGREVTLIDNRHDRGDRDRHHRRRGDRGRGGFGFYVDLGPPRVGIPRNRYIVEYDNASEDDVYDALRAPPVEELEHGYTLDEIRYNRHLRDRMRRIDLDSVNFAFGSWEVAPSQYDKLARVARAINRILDRRPDEMFLVEGHTDAVGSDIDNLTLSDRRAEEVAYILTETFDVPPENLVTQGYGEEYLKVRTEQPERANRRVAVRRITPLLARRN